MFFLGGYILINYFFSNLSTLAKKSHYDIQKANHNFKPTVNANFTKGYNSAIFRHRPTVIVVAKN